MFCLAGDSMSGLQIPASDDPWWGSVLVVGADCTGFPDAWQTGAWRGCARNRARFGGGAAPTLWDAAFKPVPQRRGATHASRRCFGQAARRGRAAVPLQLRLAAAGRRGIGRIASRRSLRGRLQRAVALPRGAAQGAAEVGALALDCHQPPLGVGKLLL